MAKRHYQTMKTDDICRLPIRDIATDDALCFMWATFPNIGQALAVMAAWGFQYKTAAFVWIKKYQKSNKKGSRIGKRHPQRNMGAYTRANAEVCLLGISSRTKAKECVRSHAVQQVIEAPIEKHSKKPDIVRDRIIELCGDVPRIELFARQKVEGWDCWGNEVE